MTKQVLIDTENRIKEHWENGEIPYLLHLCGGNESQLIEYYQNVDLEKDWLCCSHRTHYHALLFGLAPDELVEKVLQGKSMFIFRERFLCSAIVAGVCSIACGIALALKLQGSVARVHCFVGDGATDEGSFWESVRFAEGRKLPIKFIVEDNGAQCGVSTRERLGNGFDWGDCIAAELHRYDCVTYYQYVPVHPHAGCNGPEGKPTRPPIRWPIERKVEKPV